MGWLTEHIWLVALYPLIAAALIVLGRATRAYDAQYASMGLVVGATALGLIHSLIVAGQFFADPAAFPFEQNWAWLSIGNFTLSMGTLVDSMTVMMLFVVTFISLFIQIYTHGYMGHDDGYHKFYAYLALFNFSMLSLVLSTNLFQMYIFWELVGVSSYLLIGFWFTRPAAGNAALKAFLMNRVGDFGLLVGILILLLLSLSLWPTYLQANPEQAWLSFQALPAIAPQLATIGGPLLFGLMAFLVFMGPMAKSAQVPLHTWLPDAMEGPTPISALIHAATMVAAGVYLVGRVYPLFQFSPNAQATVAILGTVTAVFGATVALTQYDIKKALAYSTVSQLGFMMAAMGVGAFSAGLFHLFTHAFFKAMLFLCSGSVIHACEDEQDMRQMGGLLGKLPATGWTYLIGVFAISGLFWTSGFWSKDEILVGAASYSQVIYVILAITAGLTSFYMFRTFFMTFTGQYRGSAHVHHEMPVMTVPLIVLAVPSLFIGMALGGVFGTEWSFAHWIAAPTVAGVSAHEPGIQHAAHEIGFFTPVGILSMVIGLSGAILAWLMYGPGAVINADIFKKGLAPLFTLFSKKYYFDELYLGIVNRLYLVWANASAALDRAGIDGLVNRVGRAAISSGDGVRLLHTGQIQHYVAVIFFGVAILTLLFVYGLLG